MASIPSSGGYAEVMAGTNNYTGSNNFAGDCPQTPNAPSIPNDLTNKLYVDTLVGPPSGVGLSQILTVGNSATGQDILSVNNMTVQGITLNSVGSSTAITPFRITQAQYNQTTIMEGNGISMLATPSVGELTINNQGIGQGISINTSNNAPKGEFYIRCPANPYSIRDWTGSLGTAGQVLSSRGGNAFSSDTLEWISNGDENLQQTLDFGNTATGANAKISLTDSGVGYSTAPTLIIGNSNAGVGTTTGVPSIDFYKSGRTAATGDIVMSQQFDATNYLAAKQTFGKIECSITSNNNITGIDGALDFYSCINGVNQNVFRLNGNDNENNSFRPLDLNGNSLKTSQGSLTVDTGSSTGVGNLLINTVGAAGTGQILTTSKGAVNTTCATGGMNLTANGSGTIQLNTSGTILLNGTANITAAATTGVFSITNELHYGIMSTPVPTHIYRPTLQPLITTSPYAVNSTEFFKEGELFTFINSLGDGANELVTVSTPNFTATCMEYVLNSASATNCYAAGGYNHIEGRAELRFATDINSLFNTIPSGTFQFIHFGATQRINCLCYDPALIADKIAFGGSFTGTQGQSYNNTGGVFASNISNIVVVDITNFSLIAPINMEDAFVGSPTQGCFGVNGEVLCCGTRAYDNTFYPPATAPFYIFGGAFTQLLSTLVSPPPPAALRMVNFCPTGSLTPFNARWFDFGGANGQINMVVNDDSGRLAFGGQFTSIGASSVSFLAYTDPSLLSSFTYSDFASGALTVSVAVGKANFGYFNNTYKSGSTFNIGYDDSSNFTVQQADLNNPSGAFVLIKDNLTSIPTGFAIDLDVATPVVNFIVGSNYCWDNTTPQYVDLNGSIDMANTFYQTQASPNLPLFFKNSSAAQSAPLQYSLFQPAGAGSCLITSVNTPFINGLAPANKYSKITLAAKDNFAMGTLVGFGGDDQRILITSQFGASFAI